MKIVTLSVCITCFFLFDSCLTNQSRATHGKLSNAMEKSKDTYKGDRKVPTKKQEDSKKETKEKDDDFTIDFSFLFKAPEKKKEAQNKNENDDVKETEGKKADAPADTGDPDQEDENLYPDTGNYVVVQTLPGEDSKSTTPESQEADQSSSSQTTSNGNTNEQSSNQKNETAGVTPDTTDPSVLQPYDAKKDLKYKTRGLFTTTGLGIRIGRTSCTSGAFGDDFDLGISLVYHTNEYLSSIIFGMTSIIPERGSDLDESAKGGLGIFRLGLELRRYAFLNKTLFNPFFGLSSGISIMFWNYTHSLRTDEGSIPADSLFGLYLTAPLGVEIYRSHRTSFSIMAIPEVQVFAGRTNQGFENDYFNPYASIKLAGEFNYLPWIGENKTTENAEQ